MTRLHKTISDLMTVTGFSVQPPPVDTPRSFTALQSMHSTLLAGLQQCQAFQLPNTEEWSQEDWLAVSETIQDLCEMQMLRLPFPVCVIEFAEPHPAITIMAVEQEDGRIAAQMMVRNNDRTIVSGAICWYTPLLLPEDGWRVECKLTLDYDTDHPLTQELIDSIGSKCGESIGALLVLLLTKGVRREVVDAPSKLNRQRVKRGREPIREFTRITVTDAQEGTRSISRDPDDPRRSSPRMHLRRGHINGRNGKKWFVPPTLVNARSADEAVGLHREYRIKTTLAKAS